MSEAPSEPHSTLDENDALRAGIYRLLSRLIREAPDAHVLGFLANLEVSEDGADLRAPWAALTLAAADAEPKTLERAHFRHLVGVVQGELLPYASWYQSGLLMDFPLVELRRDLHRLGFEREPDVKEPEDHFSALCEVMAMLIESDPIEQGAFFQRHLAPWGLDFMADLAAVDTPFYSAVGQLGLAFLTREQAFTNSQGVPVRLVEPDLPHTATP